LGGAEASSSRVLSGKAMAAHMAALPRRQQRSDAWVPRHDITLLHRDAGLIASRYALPTQPDLISVTWNWVYTVPTRVQAAMGGNAAEADGLRALAGPAEQAAPWSCEPAFVPLPPDGIRGSPQRAAPVTWDQLPRHVRPRGRSNINVLSRIAMQFDAKRTTLPRGRLAELYGNVRVPLGTLCAPVAPGGLPTRHIARVVLMSGMLVPHSAGSVDAYAPAGVHLLTFSHHSDHMACQTLHGGPWHADIDGGDPSQDDQPLLRAACRHALVQTSLDLSVCRGWVKLCEMRFMRLLPVVAPQASRAATAGTGGGSGSGPAARAVVDAPRGFIDVVSVFLPLDLARVASRYDLVPLEEGGGCAHRHERGQHDPGQHLGARGRVHADGGHAARRAGGARPALVAGAGKEGRPRRLPAGAGGHAAADGAGKGAHRGPHECAQG
jgi:hypothetical protein